MNKKLFSDILAIMGGISCVIAVIALFTTDSSYDSEDKTYLIFLILTSLFLFFSKLLKPKIKNG